MTVRALVHTVPNVTGLLSVELTESYSATMKQATITCYDTSLSLGDSINFNIGFSGNSGKVFTGWVRKIIRSLPEPRTVIVCEDELSKATDYFMAADDPQAPFTRENIKTEDLIEDILNEASITNYGHDVPLEVIWATQGTVEFNLVSAISAAKQIADALAWHLYCDRNGKVWLKDRPPYWVSGDSISFTWNTISADDIIAISHSESTEELRNRVVVYGRDNRFASASQSSPYLPDDFYKTAVLASPIFDRTDLCQLVADYNLTKFNRLTESLTLQIEGDWQVEPRKFATITDSFTNTTGDWFIFQVTHSFGSGGYLQSVVVVK